jgi:hypothetical protein
MFGEVADRKEVDEERAGVRQAGARRAVRIRQLGLRGDRFSLRKA